MGVPNQQGAGKKQLMKLNEKNLHTPENVPGRLKCNGLTSGGGGGVVG